MYGLVLIKPGVGSKSSVKSYLTVTKLGNLKFVSMDIPIESHFKVDMEGVFILGLGRRQDPFCLNRRPKIEYGLRYEEVIFLPKSKDDSFNAVLFAISYIKSDLTKLATQDDSFKGIKFVREDQEFVLSEKELPEVEQMCENNSEIKEPQRQKFKKPRILFQTDTQCQKWKETLAMIEQTLIESPKSPILKTHLPKLPEDSESMQTQFSIPAGNKEVFDSPVSITKINNLDAINDACNMSLTLSLQQLHQKMDQSLKCISELKMKFQTHEELLTEIKGKTSWQMENSSQKNLVDVGDGYFVTKSAMEEAKRCRLVQKAALPIFESLFPIEEQIKMWLKPKANQNGVDSSRLNVIFRVVAGIPDIPRLSNSSTSSLCAEEQRLVRQEIGSWLNQKRQRNKRNGLANDAASSSMPPVKQAKVLQTNDTMSQSLLLD